MSNRVRQQKVQGHILSQDSRLLTPKEVAAQANFHSPVTILRAFRRGELPGYRLNARTIRFDPTDVAKWLASAWVNPAETVGKEA